MSNLRIEPVLCRTGTMDNYAWLLTDEETGQSAVVDPSEAAPIIARCKELGIKPQYIFNTHHHYDHTDANLELKALYGAQVVGGMTEIRSASAAPAPKLSALTATPSVIFCGIFLKLKPSSPATRCLTFASAVCLKAAPNKCLPH